MNTVSSAIIVIILVIPIVGCAECPPAQVVYPCECSNDLIFCGHFQTIYLKNVFQTISKYLDRDYKSYLILDLNNISITVLEDNVFSGLQFKRIFLRNLSRLKKIELKAFSGTQDYTEELTIEGDNQLLTDEKFKQFSTVVSTLTNLQSLYMDSYHLTTVPFSAFSNQKLLDIDFNFNKVRNGSIKTIDNFAFYLQNSLKDIDITNQEVNYVPKNALTFQSESKEILSVFLDNNNLNSSSFEHGLFNSTNRVMYLYLRNNNIDYLDEKIFSPFLTSNPENRLDVLGNPLVLDCRMYWMVGNRDITLFHQILGGQTTDGSHLVFLDLSHFKNCSS